MLLMTWAQARFSGDTYIVNTYVRAHFIRKYSHLSSRNSSMISSKAGPIILEMRCFIQVDRMSYLAFYLLRIRSYRQTRSTSVDDIKKTNQTNLALKGILGIRAMSELARIHGQIDAADSYAVRQLDFVVLIL
jgi:hypothetical protein